MRVMSYDMTRSEDACHKEYERLSKAINAKTNECRLFEI